MNSAYAVLWAALLVALLGYVSHRASLCTVRAVAHLLHHKSLEKFPGFMQAVLWPWS